MAPRKTTSNKRSTKAAKKTPSTVSKRATPNAAPKPDHSKKSSRMPSIEPRVTRHHARIHGTYERSNVFTSLFARNQPAPVVLPQVDLGGFPILATNHPSATRRALGRHCGLSTIFNLSLSHPHAALGFRGLFPKLTLNVKHGIEETTISSNDGHNFRLYENEDGYDSIEKKENMGGLMVAIENTVYYDQAVTTIYTDDLQECSKKFFAHMRYVFGDIAINAIQ